MATFAKLRFPNAILNLSVQEFMDFFAMIEDLDGQKIVGSIKHGLAIVEEGTIPSADQLPVAVRVWHENRSLPLDNENGVLHQSFNVISFFFYFYSFDGSDLQKQRESYFEYLLKKLGEPDSGTTDQTGIQPVNFEYVSGLPITVDHTNAFKKIHSEYQAPHPWYVSRMDITIHTYIQPNDD